MTRSRKSFYLMFYSRLTIDLDAFLSVILSFITYLGLSYLCLCLCLCLGHEIFRTQTVTSAVISLSLYLITASVR